MFEDLLRELGRLERGVRVSVKVAVDDDGYLDRHCSGCRFDFKILLEDWREKVSDERAFCPRCGRSAAATEWNTEGQSRSVTAQAMSHLHRRLNRAIENDARAFNRGQRSDGFLKMSLSHRPGPRPVLLPIEAAEALRQKLACEECACRYATLGTAFFCPACGHNSAVSMFAGAIEHVRQTMDALPALRTALADASGPDFAEDTIRWLIEDGLENLVTAFQRYAESLYSRLESAPVARRNVFQTIGEASGLWRTAIGEGYEDLLTSRELDDLAQYFLQRHLLAHTDGIVDADYLRRSNDHRYVPGQRVVVRDADVRRLASVIQKLGEQLGRRTR